jgi:hypothetical protein
MVEIKSKTLEEWLWEVKAAREENHEIRVSDDPGRREIGFTVTSEEIPEGVYHYISLTDVKGSKTLSTTLVAFFGFKTEAELRQSLTQPEGRERIVTGKG